MPDNGRMMVDEHIGALRREGDLLIAAASDIPLETVVPSCPGWTVRDLLRHLGMVHRWAGSYVAQARTEQRGDDQAPDIGPVPADHDLVAWFRDGHAALVETLEAAPTDLSCWTFFAAPTPLAFWARRQAHETAIHRVDAELAAKTTPHECPASFATDGIDELLCGFFGRPARVAPVGPPWSLMVVTSETDEAWSIRVSRDGRVTRRGRSETKCVLRGSANDLYLALWNRRSTDDLHVDGDRGVLDRWRDHAAVTWS